MRSNTRLQIAAGVLLAIAVTFAIAGNARGGVPVTPAASFTATDFYWTVTGSTATFVHIEPGQSVAFAYPMGFSTHNADFGSLAPTSCTQSTGADSGSVPPLPHTFTAAPWSGTCTFNTDQTYQFYCDLHNSMHGTIVVGTGGPSGGAGTPPWTGPSDKNSLIGDALRIARTQHSTRVRGSAAVAVKDSKLVVEVFANPKSLAAASTAKLRLIGRVTKSSLATGRAKFSARINKRARAALVRTGRLGVRVRVRLTDPSGSVTTATRNIVLKK